MSTPGIPNLKEVYVTNSAGFKALMRDSEGRNRGPIAEFADRLDPVGMHCVSLQFPHNDVEWRCCWMCKFADQDAPVEIWMDNGFDAFEKFTSLFALPGVEEITKSGEA